MTSWSKSTSFKILRLRGILEHSFKLKSRFLHYFQTLFPFFSLVEIQEFMRLNIIISFVQAPNPKKDRLIRAGPTKKFLDDPNRAIEPHEYIDFHKELVQVLNEVKQESELLPQLDELCKPKYSKFSCNVNHNMMIIL